MGGIVALLWNPGPLVLELHSKSVPRHWMKALPLALRQSVNVQPGQGSGTARAPSLQSLQLMEALVEEPGEVGLVSGNLLQGLIVWEEPLTTHSCQILLYPLCGRLGADYL
jgi:hypothetical protein